MVAAGLDSTRDVVAAGFCHGLWGNTDSGYVLRFGLH